MASRASVELLAPSTAPGVGLEQVLPVRRGPGGNLRRSGFSWLGLWQCCRQFDQGGHAAVALGEAEGAGWLALLQALLQVGQANALRAQGRGFRDPGLLTLIFRVRPSCWTLICSRPPPGWRAMPCLIAFSTSSCRQSRHGADGVGRVQLPSHLQPVFMVQGLERQVVLGEGQLLGQAHVVVAGLLRECCSSCDRWLSMSRARSASSRMRLRTLFKAH